MYMIYIYPSSILTDRMEKLSMKMVWT